MIFSDFLGHLFHKNEPRRIVMSEYRHCEDGSRYVNVYAHALFTCVDLLASLLAGCEVRILKNGKETFTEDYDKFNISPNNSQNAFDFWKEFYTKLLAKGEVLCVKVNGKYIVADSYTAEVKGLDDIVFSNVSRFDATIDKTFSVKDVIYLHYTNLELEYMLKDLADFYSQQLGVAEKKYERSSEEKGILNVDAQATSGLDFEENFNNLMNTYFKDYFSKGSKVLPLFNGYTYNPGEMQKNYSNEASDMKALYDEALTRFAQAYKIPASLIRGDVAGIKEAYDVMLTNAIKPIAKQVSTELTAKLYGVAERKVRKAEVDTKTIKYIGLFDIATAADKLVGASIVKPNELRKYLGIVKDSGKYSDSLFMTKNYVPVENILDDVKGGEQNGIERQGDRSE